MIHFEIVTSPDENVIAPFCFHQNQIYLGKEMGDLRIKDHELQKSHVMLEVIGTDLLLHPQRGVEHYLLNGKRASAIRKLKDKDVITIGKTSFKIIQFKETEKLLKKTILNEKLNKLIEENSSRLPVIEALTKKMKT